MSSSQEILDRILERTPGLQEMPRQGSMIGPMAGVGILGRKAGCMNNGKAGTRVSELGEQPSTEIGLTDHFRSRNRATDDTASSNFLAVGQQRGKKLLRVRLSVGGRDLLSLEL